MTPEADPARRIQGRCTPCGTPNTLHMLEARANLVLVRCGACDALYWLDSGCGRGGRPETADVLPQWPNSVR